MDTYVLLDRRVSFLTNMRSELCIMAEKEFSHDNADLAHEYAEKALDVTDHIDCILEELCIP